MGEVLPADAAAATCQGPAILHATRYRLRLRPAGLDLCRVDAGALTAALSVLPGVRGVRINAKAQCVIVEHDGGPGTGRRVMGTLAGFEPARFEPTGAGHADGVAGTAPAGDDGQPEPAAGEEAPPSPVRMILVGLAALATPLLPRPAVTLAGIAPTLGHGADTLVRRGIKVPVLDALSVGLATLRGEHMTANIAQFLLELSGYIEASTGHRSDVLIAGLMQPNPESAMVERGGEVVRVPFATLVEGERVHVGAGQAIPIDGTVLDGAATVNQASVTGESLPIPKEAGAPVLSGTVLEEGRLVVRADRVGDSTTTARIARFIREALGRRGQTQRLAEQLADRRVWLSLGTGAAVFALTRDTRRLESLFLVDYSCATRLAPAVAVKSTLYQATSRGILIKGGEALERLAGIDTVVFDKTGTLTHGDLAATDILTFTPADWPRERFLAAIASIAEHATHPVAAAVVALARAEGVGHIGHEEVDFVIGHGLQAHMADGLLQIGSRHYLVDHENVSFQPHEPLLDGLIAEGKTLLHVALDGRPLGVIALRDRPRAEAGAVLARLRSLGIRRLAMVTGDRRETALRIAGGLDLDAVEWEADPEAKAAIIRRLRDRGRVAFVGDGVNDGPALMSADLGIAMPGAADIARASADIVLLDDRLDGLADALALARGTMGLIRQSFATAVGVNTAILAGASFGWLPPVVSSVLHNGTTIALLGRALAGAGAPVRPS
ncbi:MAG: heavy metal translocating P-type ATPase [Alphaproteobacteria bacterium]|nr:heavy metal translocating P-type ATPase [Alphaproteobacteria bacterium]